MILFLCILMLPDSAPVLPVHGFPPGEEPYLLVVVEFSAATQIALARGDELLSGYTEFPGIMNTAKASVSYNPDSGVLTVYSQYPFTADYYTAEYSVGGDFELSLISGEHHDYYGEMLQRMYMCYRDHDHEGVLGEAWSVFYPGSNHLGREMCVVLLLTGVSGMRERMNAGTSGKEAMEWLGELYEAGFYLSGEFMHLAALGGYPEGLPVPCDEFAAALEELALILDSMDYPDRAVGVRKALYALESR